MKIDIQSLHFTSNLELNNFITEKLNKLDHFHSKIESANVCLRLDKADNRENKVCEIRLIIPGKDLFAKKQCGTFEEATDQVLDALQQQLKTAKSKLENS